jgi:hypothetical protein
MLGVLLRKSRKPTDEILAPQMNLPQNRHGSRHFVKGAEGETAKLVPGSDLKQWKGAQNWGKRQI